MLDRYISDERLKDALFGQGVIGTWGGPYDHGTASIKLMHYQGDLDGQGPVWGYVEGGMGMVSFAIADAAARGRRAARLRRPGREDRPRRGRRARGRDRDPRPHDHLQRRPEGRRCELVGAEEIGSIDSAYRQRSSSDWKIRSPVVKFNAALDRLPNWTAAPGEDWPARATIDVAEGMDEAQKAFERCAAGEPAVAFGEIYIQTGYDPSPAPEGKHLMSVFGQYAPYDISGGDWEARQAPASRSSSST